MTMQDYRQAVHLMEKYPELMDFDGSSTQEYIDKAESKLGVKFSPTYRSFLESYSVGAFGSTEIYGIVQSNPDRMMIPNVVGATMLGRQDYNLPQHLILISELGDGSVYCLDCSQEGEGPVIIYWSTFPREVQTYEIEAESFGEFFLGQIKIALDVLQSD